MPPLSTPAAATRLAVAERRFKASAAAAAAAGERRNQAIVDAHRAGMPAIEIARATGLGRARVSQILSRAGVS